MITNSIPTIWAALLLRELRKSLVYGGMCNRNYQGEIKEKGNTVKITGLIPPTVKTYVRGVPLDNPEFVNDDTRTLVIDQEKYFNAAFDDLDLVQSSVGGMKEYCRDQASFAFMDQMDRFIAAKFVDVDAANVIGATTITKANIYEVLEALSVKLSEADVPTSERWAVLPPWMASLVRQSDYFTHATEMGDKTVRNGVIGMAAGFTIAESNNVPNTAGNAYKVLAGHRMAITMADQVNKVEAFRHPDYFSDNLKGLVNYGAKTVFPKALAVVTANK